MKNIFFTIIVSIFIASSAWADLFKVGSNTRSTPVTNATMEADTSCPDAGCWASVGTPTTNERSSEQKYIGSYSRKFIVDAAGEGIQSTAVTTVSGMVHAVWMQVYSPANTSVRVVVRNGVDDANAVDETFTITPGAWSVIKREYTEASGKGGANAYVQVLSPVGVTTGTYYVDDQWLTYGDSESNNNTIEDNVFYHDGHALIDGFTKNNVIRNNIARNDGYKPDLQGEVTISNASPAVVTKASHGMHTNGLIRLTTTGTLPTGLTALTSYYIKEIDADTFSLCATSSCATPINTSSDGSGTHTLRSMFDPDPTDPPGSGMFSHRGFSWDSLHRAYVDYNLFEGNRIGHAGTNPNNNGQNNLEFSAGSCIIRYNDLFGADGSGLYFKNSEASWNNRAYNNTIYNNGLYTGDCTAEHYPSCSVNANIKDGIRYTSTSKYNKVVNNLVYGNVYRDIECSGTTCYENNTLTNNWCKEELDGCVGSADPLFVDTTMTITLVATLPNLTLQSGSPAKDAGTYLTQVNDADGCDAGTADCMDMVVDDALYFQDGTWGSSLSTITPDEICISASSDVTDLTRCRAISSINYATNTITLATEISFSNNEYVWLYKKSDGVQVLYGAAPDIGAHEYEGVLSDSGITGAVISGAVVK